MNTKLIFGRGFACVAAVALVPFLSGCLCSSELRDEIGKRDIDTFTPSAVYLGGTKSSGYALEGTRRNHFLSAKGGPVDEFTTFPENTSAVPIHAFLMIPRRTEAFAWLQTNANPTIAQIEKMPINPQSHLITKPELPSGYKKIADLPTNHANLQIEDHNPRLYLTAAMPAVFVFDLVTFPFQWIYVIAHPALWFSLG